MKHRIFSAVILFLLCASLVFTGGCIYFNLLYNAESSFDTAYAAHRRLLKDNPDSVIVLPADIDNGYKKTIDKCNKVFEIYPKKIKQHGDALFLMGKAYFYDGEYDRAIHSFKQLQERFPGHPLYGEACLYMGRAFLKKEDLDKAEETFALVLEKYPALNKNQEITMLNAEIAIHREGKTQAIELLEKTYKTAKTPERKLELIVKIGQLYKDVKLYDKAISALESAPRPRGLPEQVFRVDFLRVSCYMEMGSLPRALELIVPMIATKPYVSHVPVMLLKKGEILDRLNKTDEAMAVFKQIIDIYAASDYVGNAWFELGRINQIKKGDLTKAKECYDKAAAVLKDPAIKDVASQRSKAIDTILKMRAGAIPKDSVKTDTVTPADYKIGELFWLELDQPDSAFKHYCLSAADTAHRSLMPKALYAAAWIARYALADTVKADSLYALLLKRYPVNMFSRKAQEAKGGPVTIMTRQDSALEAFHGAERLYWENNSPDSAAEAYVKVYDSFGETEYGPKSLYAAAWIYDFVLDKNRTAKKLYELLCDSFPKSSCCLEAKPRLKTVSDTVAALRAQKKLPQRETLQPSGAAKTAQPVVPNYPKKPDSLSATGKDSSQQKTQDIITDRDTAAHTRPPATTTPQNPAPAAAVPPPQNTVPAAVAQPPAPPVPAMRRMRPGSWPGDSASAQTVPPAKPDSILYPRPAKPATAGETIGR
jgi:tetratricopeptide (TPR) repeat protein